jgi:hypothetical protein
MWVSGESNTHVRGVKCVIIIAGKPEEKRPLEARRYGLEVNIEM